MDIAIDKVLPNPEQPRIEFNPAELESLSESISTHGVIQPIVVERTENGFFILHDGERRLRASKMAGKDTIPAHVVPGLNGSGSRERLVRAMVANIQRSDLNVVEEAKAYQRMIEEQGMSVLQISVQVGVSAPRIYSRLRILELDEIVQKHILCGKLPKDNRSTEALLSIQDPEIRLNLANKAAEKRMTVNGIVEACRRVNEHLAEQNAPHHAVPAIRIATAHESLNRPRWDALAQIGRLPPWILVEVSARDTCRQCSWYEQASDAICKTCPLPQLLTIMIGKASK